MHYHFPSDLLQGLVLHLRPSLTANLDLRCWFLILHILTYCCLRKASRDVTRCYWCSILSTSTSPYCCTAPHVLAYPSWFSVKLVWTSACWSWTLQFLTYSFHFKALLSPNPHCQSWTASIRALRFLSKNLLAAT